jgi:hypothetical protein
MLSSFVLGVAWFVVLVTLLSVGVSMAITLVGIPILVGSMYLWVAGARLERLRVGALLGVRIQDPYRPLPEGPFLQHLKARVLDRYTWLDLLYLFLLFPLGIVEFVLAVVAITVPGLFLVQPLYVLAGDGTEIGDRWHINTLPESLGVALLTVPLLLALPYILVGAGRGHAWLARNLLGANREAQPSA